MDPPVGYPIYVSPLQTSYIDGHDRFNSTVLSKLTDVVGVARYVFQRCMACSAIVQAGGHPRRKPVDVEKSVEESTPKSGEVDPLTGLPYPAHPGVGQEEEGEVDDFWKPVWIGKTVAVVKCSEVFGSHHLLKWPDSLQHVSECVDKQYQPSDKAKGTVLHEWRPFHPRTDSRSPVDKVLVLLLVEEDHEYVIMRDPGIEATLL